MEIAPGVYSMGQWKGGHVHAFLLDTGDSLTLVDTLYDTDAHRVLDQIRKIGRTVEDLNRIVLTHAHRSHIGGLAKLQQLSGAAVYSHEWEADIISGDREAQRVTIFPKSPLKAYPLQIGCALGVGKHPPCEVDHFVRDGDFIGPLQVLEVPGHTPGSLALHWPERKLLAVGDVVVTWPMLGAGWESFTLNARHNHQSVGKLSEFSDTEVIAVGHGAPIPRNGARIVRRLLENLERSRRSA